jgi:outer membrane protein assembly factor BamB
MQLSVSCCALPNKIRQRPLAAAVGRVVYVFSSALALLAAGQSAYGTTGTTSHLWQITLDGGIWGSPTVAQDGSIIVGTARASVGASTNYVNLRAGRLYSISPAGTTNWSMDVGGAVWATPALGVDGTIYFGVEADYGGRLPAQHRFYAVSQTGTIKWQIAFPNIIDSSPAIGADGSIYITDLARRLYSISPGGATNWQFRLAATSGDEAHQSSPSIGPDGTIYCAAGLSLYALRPDGSQKWAFSSPTNSFYNFYSWPAIGRQGELYLGCDDGQIYAVNADGTLRWTARPTDAGLNGLIDCSPAIAANGSIAITYNDGRVFSVDSAGRQKWLLSGEGFLPASSLAILADGTVCVGRGDQSLLAIDPNGTPSEIIHAPDHAKFPAGPTILPDGTLYVGSDDGTLYAIKLDQGPAASPWPMNRKNSAHTARADSPAFSIQLKSGVTSSAVLTLAWNQTGWIDVSPDLKNWSELFQLPAPGEFSITLPTGAGNQFYRVRPATTP